MVARRRRCYWTIRKLSLWCDVLVCVLYVYNRLGYMYVVPSWYSISIKLHNGNTSLQIHSLS